MDLESKSGSDMLFLRKDSLTRLMWHMFRKEENIYYN